MSSIFTHLSAIVLLLILALASPIAASAQAHSPQTQAVITAAEKGDAQAQFLLGVRFGKDLVAKTAAEAAQWLQRAADQGHAKAQARLGSMYFIGKGVPENKALAAALYRKSAAQGEATGQYLLGVYLLTSDQTEAAKWLEKAATQGQPHAQYLFGRMIEDGTGRPKSDVEAAAWYGKSAEQGHAPAQSRLASMHDYGRGIPENHPEGLKWARKAAEQGDAVGQGLLGLHYSIGSEVEKDLPFAYAWALLSASQGNPYGKKLQGQLEAMLTPEQVAEGKQLAQDFRPQRRRDLDDPAVH